MKFTLIVCAGLFISACSSVHKGEFRTITNQPLVFIRNTTAVTVTPGPLEVRVGDAFSDWICFEHPKNNKIKIPTVAFGTKTSGEPYARELISHYGTRQEIFVSNLGDPYVDAVNFSCSTFGDCWKSEPAVSCPGGTYGEHSATSKYREYKSNPECKHVSQTYAARSEYCDGTQMVYFTKQDYLAYDSFDFINSSTEVPEAYFDSTSTKRTKQLSRSEGTCYIKSPL